MATKKQKREAALARREEFLNAQRASGLAAQESSRVHEEKVQGLITARSKALSDRMEASLKAEIVATAERFGERVRIAEDCQIESARKLQRMLWTDFLAGLSRSPHRHDALSAYYEAYRGSDEYVLRSTLNFVNTTKMDEHDCPPGCVVHRLKGERYG